MISEMIQDQRKPLITLENGKIKHSGSPCAVVLKKDVITVGCMSISPEAAQHIMDRYQEHYVKVSPASVVLE